METKPKPETLLVALLIGLVAAFLFPYLLLGRSLFSLDLITVFQPWLRHLRQLWPSVSPIRSPLLDPVQFFFPRALYLTRALQEGWLPFWWPDAYGGSPFLAGQQTPVLYPGSWALALVPVTQQPGWSAFFHISMAVAGAYGFLRELALRPAAAAVGAAAFAFNGFLIGWLAYPNVSQSTFCWLPVIVFLWERGRRGDDLRWIAACAAALGLAMLGGHPQMAIYLWGGWLAWALFRSVAAGQAQPARLARWVLLPALLGAALSSGQLLPALDFVPRTSRAGRVPWATAVAGGMPLAQLWTFFLPRLFGDGTLASAYEFWLPAGDHARLSFQERCCYPGVATLVLAAAGAASALRRALPGATAAAGPPALARFSLALLAAALLLGMGTPLYWPFWRLAPGFGQFNAIARILCLAAWALTCLAAAGAQELTDPDPKRRAAACRAAWAGAAVCALVCLAGFYVYGGAAPRPVIETLARQGRPSPDSQATRDLLLAFLWIAVAAAAAGAALPQRGARLSPAWLAGGLLTAVVADLFTFGAGLNPAADPALLRAQPPELAFLRGQSGLFRFLSIGPAGHELELRQRMPSDLPSAFGLADLNGTDSFVTRRRVEWEAALARFTGASPWAAPGAPALRAAGVRFYLTGSNQILPGLEAAAGPAVQEDRAALPYARLHLRARAEPDRAALLAALASPARSPATALVAEARGAIEGPERVIPCAARRLNGNRLAVEAAAPQPALLVVCEQYEPGWSAAIDGTPARPLPADHLWLALPLPAGRHTVTLTYAPQVCRVALFAALVAGAALAGLLVAAPRRNRSRLATTRPATPPA